STQSLLTFSAPHGLVPDQAVAHGGEIRFVAAIVDPTQVQLNAPLSVTPAPGAAIGPTITYLPATDMPSIGIFDYWIPDTAVQRLLVGAVADRMELHINGDFHQFQFTGPAQ